MPVLIAQQWENSGNLAEAVSFQSTCRKSGYNQAFVVAFRDNIRTNDPELFKK